ncbi:transketolase [Neisseria sp. CCUG17229]|uniref:Transketolase n=1 Tax=Neisseria brasiliensis TaxID=2666100 RepID=A0A5Q3RY59_9NEIS|nr:MULTISPECIES: transketolase [Neisseria]MRN38848.1 transketolase [Neisseria brasiliensis]PJO09115.1 transketolase [Neisseria sp. N95_16]PJO78257.1 transketolase [Neisseria sp. N177_16]QGL24283.1 transketolase [Neisseria brasiliensis]
MSQLANAIRFLSADAVQKANSGHPGAPMGMAEMAEVLWTQYLNHNPANPKFYNRDRFVLSNGHASMILYSLLHLTGYDVSIEDLKNFRQLHSKTPGHPEYGYTDGVETTTGPLGQGIANAVGMALAEKILAAEFNKDGLDIVDHYTYVFLGDGCLMEGVSHEACSLAGTLGLGKLIVLYDDNNISIDGKVDGWFTEDIPQRFESYGWHVVPNVNGHDTAAIQTAIDAARAETGKPSIICCKTLIGKGAATKEGSHKTHGAPLGADEIEATRKHLGWTHAAFEVPQEVYEGWDAKEKGAQLENEWNKLFAEYQSRFPEEAAEFVRRMDKELPKDFDAYVQTALKEVCDKAETIATRKASQNSIETLAKVLPEFVGGSADLTPSNLTDWSNSKAVTAQNGGNYVHYGVREFGMGAIMNGLALHGGVKPFGATFLMFSEYQRNALRMAALMKINPIFVFTHDSIGLGEDGPTHQPVEQTATLRLIPNMDVWRPCDTAESLVAWAEAVKAADHPSSLIFSRQNLKFLQRSDEQLENIQRGGYVISEAQGEAKAVIIATGSEVELALNAQAALAEEGIAVRVVSMPSTNAFDRQDAAYQASVLPANLPRVAVEAGVTDGWYKYVGLNGKVVGLDRFGESAPAELLFKEFGFTTENVVATVKSVL